MSYDVVIESAVSLFRILQVILEIYEFGKIFVATVVACIGDEKIDVVWYSRVRYYKFFKLIICYAEISTSRAATAQTEPQAEQRRRPTFNVKMLQGRRRRLKLHCFKRRTAKFKVQVLQRQRLK